MPTFALCQFLSLMGLGVGGWLVPILSAWVVAGAIKIASNLYVSADYEDSRQPLF